MDVKKIGEFIRKKRKENGFTQKELADKLFITDRAISKWERGINCPDISLLKDLCSILGVSINELLSGEILDKLEVEQSDDIIISTVKGYTEIEKKKNRKLLIFTIILLIFYVGLVFAMYLIFNQINKTNGLNWEIMQNKKLAERFYFAIENYDYEELKKMQRESFGYGTLFNENDLENENKCDEYREQRNRGERLSGPDIICRLKYFEDNGVKFISHKFLEQLYLDETGEFGVSYILIMEYNNVTVELGITTVVHNGVITHMSSGWGYMEDEFFYQKYKTLCNNIDLFFNWSKLDFNNYYLEWIE